MSLKEKIITELKQSGAYDVRFADPMQFTEYAINERLPQNLWPSCKSVIVFIMARPPETNNTYVGTYSPFKGPRCLSPAPSFMDTSSYGMVRLGNIMIDFITLRCICFLQNEGFQSYTHPQQIQNKLYAWQSGLGVYGRSGVIINPVLGNRIQIGSVLTDAVLEPDPVLENYNPCENCYACVKSCPGDAYGVEKSYHNNWNREKCENARKEVDSKGFYCHNCFKVCPAKTLKDEILFNKFIVKNKF